MFKKPFVIVDLETSGVDPKRDEIIEVALIRYENGKEVARYDDLIKVDFKLPPIITVITGITDGDLEKDGKDKAGVLADVQKHVEGAYIVGHNINFDTGFLKEHGVDLGGSLGFLDTIPLAQILMPGALSYSLESLTDDLEISHEDAHRAMADVEATLALFRHLEEVAGELPAGLLDEMRAAMDKSLWESAEFFADVKGKPGSKMAPVIDAEMAKMVEDIGASRALGVEEVLGEGGVLQRVKEGYESRGQQIEMSQNVLNAFEQGYHLICEAPTGVGKSLAYLTAAAHTAIANKSKVVISTNTINLQEQLHEKDIPLLHSVYREETQSAGVRVALLKGRRHYLCLRRFADFKRRSRYSPGELILLLKIMVWQATTHTGDSSEIHLSRNERLLWDFELCSEKKHCSVSKCKPFGDCYLHKARAEAEDADIIIVNHALLCSDIEQEGGLLPDYQYLVIDEGHHFEEVATHAFSLEIKQENIGLPIKMITQHLDEYMKGRVGEPPEGMTAASEAAGDLQQRVDNFFSILVLFVSRNVEQSGFTENLLITPEVSGSDGWVNLGSSAEELHRDVRAWIKQLRVLLDVFNLMDDKDMPAFVDELTLEIEILSEQMGHLLNFFDEEHESAKLIRWIRSDFDGAITIQMAPLQVGPDLKEKLYEEKKSIVLTSATLGVQLNVPGIDHAETPHPFTYLRNMLGLDEHWEEVILDSPFDYETQTYVLVPNDIEDVRSPRNLSQVSELFGGLIGSIQGGMLGLFTSYGAIETVYLNLMKEPPQGTKVLAQRISGGRNKVLKAYMKDPARSVLFGTSSFWEGVDIQGEALTTLVMHKMPFDVPSDPIHAVRGQLFGNSFMEYSLPRSILRFRQGFGRLIRSKRDYGVMIVLDQRTVKKDWGKQFMWALPDGVTVEQAGLAEIPEKVRTWLELQRSEG